MFQESPPEPPVEELPGLAPLYDLRDATLLLHPARGVVEVGKHDRHRVVQRAQEVHSLRQFPLQGGFSGCVQARTGYLLYEILALGVETFDAFLHVFAAELDFHRTLRL